MTRNTVTRPAVGLALICLLVRQAGGFESGLVETEGAMRTWRTARGLPSDSVTAIIQTRDGFLWVGTSRGLVRFDGDKFTETPLMTSPGTAPIWVTALCEDGDGNLWIGSQQDGLFELSHGTVRRYTQAQGLLDDNVTSLAASSGGLVWIGTKSGLNVWFAGGFRALTTRDGLPDNLVSSVHVGRSGTVWITTRGGMCQFKNGRIEPYALDAESQGRSPEYLGAYEDRNGNLWAYGDTYLMNLTGEGKRFNFFRGSETASERIWSFCGGRDGRLWFGTSGSGLSYFDDNRFQPVIPSEMRWPFDVRAICEDREGNLWLGTDGGGLVQLRPQPVHVLSVSQGLPSSTPTALALDAGGRVHLGLARGGLFVGESDRFDRLASGGGFEVQNFVSSLCITRDRTVWAGTLGGGLFGLRDGRGVQFTTANGLADDAVLAVCTDDEGAVWASTAAGTVHRFTGATPARFDTANGLTGSRVTAMIPSASGGLWLGTEDGAILQSVKEKFVVARPADRTEKSPILALHESRQSALWVGTGGAGLACLSKGAISSWTTRNGLPSDVIAGVVEDAATNLWLASAVGIYRVDRSSVQKALSDSQAAMICKFVAGAKTSGEVRSLTGGPRALLASDGKLWFATSDGVLNVDMRRPEIESSPLPIYLESVSFNNEPATSLLRGAPWSASESNIVSFALRGELLSMDVRFTALGLSAPEKVRFRYKLEGSDADWVDATSRSARYGRLPFGHYTFRVAARNGEGGWQEAAQSFSFEVPTPLYLRWWAISLYAVASVASVAGVVRVVSHRRLRRTLALMEQQQSLERERMRIARDMHDEIGSKLTKISFLSEHVRVDAKSAGPLAGKIEAIADTSRDLLQTMDEIVWVVNPRNDTLEHLTDYLGHYAVEYFQNTSVECDLRLPRAIAHHPLSSEARHNLFLTFEEALNNVLKHASATKVNIEMIVNAPEFEIVIADNGRGFETPATSPGRGRNGNGGNGLRNMRQRLADIGGECDVRSKPGSGTTVSLRVHLNRKPPGKP